MKQFYRLTITFFLALCCLHLQAQPADSLGQKKAKGFFTVHGGGSFAEFSNGHSLHLGAFDENALRGWRAGFTMGLLDTKYYQMRLELGFVKRGAREVFSDGALLINSLSELNYIQVSFLPLGGKLGYRNTGIFVNAGGYGSWLASGKNTSSYANGKALKILRFEDDLKTIDYGLSVGGGIYYKHHLIELRIEQGLAPVYTYLNGSSLYNRSLNLILHL